MYPLNNLGMGTFKRAWTSHWLSEDAVCWSARLHWFRWILYSKGRTFLSGNTPFPGSFLHLDRNGFTSSKVKTRQGLQKFLVSVSYPANQTPLQYFIFFFCNFTDSKPVKFSQSVGNHRKNKPLMLLKDWCAMQTSISSCRGLWPRSIQA